MCYAGKTNHQPKPQSKPSFSIPHPIIKKMLLHLYLSHTNKLSKAVSFCDLSSLFPKLDAYDTKSSLLRTRKLFAVTKPAFSYWGVGVLPDDATPSWRERQPLRAAIHPSIHPPRDCRKTGPDFSPIKSRLRKGRGRTLTYTERVENELCTYPPSPTLTEISDSKSCPPSFL